MFPQKENYLLGGGALSWSSPTFSTSLAEKWWERYLLDHCEVAHRLGVTVNASLFLSHLRLGKER